MSHEVLGNEYRLDNPPADCIQSVKFGKTDSTHLLTASWDCTVRLYDVIANQMRTHYTHEAPVLDCDFQGNSWCWSGGCDNVVKRFDLSSHNEFTVGSHDAPVRCIEHVADKNIVASGGFDKHLKFWDTRQADSSRSKPVGDHVLSGKVYSMSACGEKLIVGTSGRKIYIYDLRNMSLVQKESMLKYQIRCVKSFADRQGFVVSSIEGRIAVEYLDPSPEIQKQHYAFKCHRNKDPRGMEVIYPVNTISFHQRYNTFATGGSDGFVSIWDGKNKKRLVNYRRYPTSISSVSFTIDGSLLAIACSYMNTTDEADQMRDVHPDCIYIRRINDNEVRTTNKNNENK